MGPLVMLVVLILFLIFIATSCIKIVPQAHAYADAGEFGADTMEPKVRAAIRFCEERPDRECIIGSIADAANVVAGRAGTRIHY